MKALSMSDVVFLQEKYNHSIHVINCYLSNVIRTIIYIEWEMFTVEIHRLKKSHAKTYASVARRFKFIPPPPPLPLSLDKNISEWASVKLWCMSNAQLSFNLTYWASDCLFNLAKLLISRCSRGRCERRKGKTFDLNGKFVASWTAIWNSSTLNVPLYNLNDLMKASKKNTVTSNLLQSTWRATSIFHQSQHLYPVQIESTPPGNVEFSLTFGCLEQIMNWQAMPMSLLGSR